MNSTAKAPEKAQAQVAENQHEGSVRRPAPNARLRLATLASHVDGRDALMIAMTVTCGVIASLGGMALAFANERSALWAAVGVLVCFIVMLWLIAIEPVGDQDDTTKGEVSNLSHEKFDGLLEQTELIVPAEPPHAHDADKRFEQLVREALDDLPDFLQAILDDNVAVLIRDDGADHNHYGLYHGGTVVHGFHGHTILIYRDTLVRDFGHDSDELRRQVAITVRHEVAHHLGADERRVAELGL